MNKVYETVKMSNVYKVYKDNKDDKVVMIFRNGQFWRPADSVHHAKVVISLRDRIPQ